MISIDTENAFDQNSTQFIMKILGKNGEEGNLLNLIKSIYKKPTANT